MSQYKAHAESDELSIEESKAKLYNYLKNNAVGKDNAVSGKELDKLVPQKYTTVKDMVSDLRNSRMLPVIGYPNKGYYVVSSTEELDEQLERLNEQIENKKQKRRDLAATYNRRKYE